LSWSSRCSRGRRSDSRGSPPECRRTLAKPATGAPVTTPAALPPGFVQRSEVGPRIGALGFLGAGSPPYSSRLVGLSPQAQLDQTSLARRGRGAIHRVELLEAHRWCSRGRNCTPEMIVQATHPDLQTDFAHYRPEYYSLIVVLPDREQAQPVHAGYVQGAALNGGVECSRSTRSPTSTRMVDSSSWFAVVTTREHRPSCIATMARSAKSIERLRGKARAHSGTGQPRKWTSLLREMCPTSSRMTAPNLERPSSYGTSDYERTEYIVADHSPGLLEDTEKSGVLAEHAKRVVRVHVPPSGLSEALRLALPRALGALRAVHANYVLDSLPFSILSCTGRGVFELRVRTRLVDDGTGRIPPPPAGQPQDIEACLSRYAPFDRAAQRASSFECEYVPVARQDLPFLQLIPEFDSNQASRESMQLVHSHGAVRFLGEVLNLLTPDGYLVGVDYSMRWHARRANRIPELRLLNRCAGELLPTHRVRSVAYGLPGRCRGGRSVAHGAARLAPQGQRPARHRSVGALRQGDTSRGQSKNLAFENDKGSKLQKDWLEAYDAKLAPKAGKMP